MSRGKSINLYLMDGDVNGRVSVRLQTGLDWLSKSLVLHWSYVKIVRI